MAIDPFHSLVRLHRAHALSRNLQHWEEYSHIDVNLLLVRAHTDRLGCCCCLAKTVTDGPRKKCASLAAEDAAVGAGKGNLNRRSHHMYGELCHASRPTVAKDSPHAASGPFIRSQQSTRIPQGRARVLGPGHGQALATAWIADPGPPQRHRDDIWATFRQHPGGIPCSSSSLDPPAATAGDDDHWRSGHHPLTCSRPDTVVMGKSIT
jgi:hypothetical protein